MNSPAVHHAQQILNHLRALKHATAHTVPGVQGRAIGDHSDRPDVALPGPDYYEIINNLALGMTELAPTLRQLLFSLTEANKDGGLTVTPSGGHTDARRAMNELNRTSVAAQNFYDNLNQAAQPLRHVVDGERRKAAATANADREMAIAHVRGNMFPPLPEPYADWLIKLRDLTRGGCEGDALLEVPAYIQETGMLPRDARRLDDGRLTITLYEALSALHQTDLLDNDND